MPDSRLFIGIPPDADTAEGITSFVRAPRNLPPGFRWIGPEQWHFTALFLGNIPDKRLPDIIETLGTIVAMQARFTLHFDQYTYRFRQKQPAMLWAQYRIHPALNTLYRQLYSAMSPFAELEPMREEILPHITLARIRKLRKVPLEPPERATLPPFTVISMNLYKSTLHSDGTRYTALHTFALAES